MSRIHPVFFLVPLALLTVSSCGTFEKIAVNSLSKMLSGGGGAAVFTSDDDVKLVAESLPFSLKLYETLLERSPDNADLSIETGIAFVMYSGAFVLIPSEMMDDDQWREARREKVRAKKLFSRGRDYILSGLDARHKGFMGLLNDGQYDDAAAMLTDSDTEAALWAGAAWLGMASLDPLDLELVSNLDKGVLLLYRSLELNADNGSLHDILIQVQLSLPGSILLSLKSGSPSVYSFLENYYSSHNVGSSPLERAMHHYNRTLEIGEGSEISSRVTMATSLSVREQDVGEFRNYLKEVLDIDPDMYPETRLITAIQQNKARWLLENEERFFITGL